MRCPAGAAAAVPDFYTVYQSLGRVDGVDNLWCWSHIRRYFVRAGDAHRDLQAWTQAWLERIGALYRAHSALAAAPTGSPQWAQAAAQFDTTLQVIDTERHAQAANAHLMHPAAVKVLATLDREWDGLICHREFPELPLDNNASERALRGPVVGRKNFYGSGSKPPPSWPVGSDHHRHRRTRRPQPAGLPGRLPQVRPDRWHTALRHGAGPIPARALNPDDHAAWTRHPDTAGTDPPSESARVA